MENNNLQNDVNNVEQNKQVNNGKKKNEVKKTIALVVLVLVLVLALGIGAGLMFSGKGGDVVNQIVPGAEKNENKNSKKIDESKPWVYDADYEKDKQNKNADNYYKSDDLKVPFININSKDAEKANSEIKNLYEQMYSEFGTKNSYGAKKVYLSEYKYYENKNILSVVLRSTDSIVNGGSGTSKLYIYNFNLDTLAKATNDEMAKICGLNSINEVEEKISKWNKRQKDFEKAYPDKVAAEYEKVVDDLYFIDKDGKLNFVYITVASGRNYTSAVVEKVKDIEDFYEFDSIDKDNNSQAEYVTILNAINENNFKNMGIDRIRSMNYDYETFKTTDYNTVKGIIDEVKKYKLEEKDIKSLPEMNHIIISYDNTNISLHYNDIGNTFCISKGGETENDEYKCWTSSSNDISTLKQLVNNYTDNYTIVKRLSPSGWAGSSMHEIRLCQNGNVYHVTFNGNGNKESDISTTDLIAMNAESIEEKTNGQAVEGIVIKGKNINKVKDNVESWILFENN